MRVAFALLEADGEQEEEDDDFDPVNVDFGLDGGGGILAALIA